MIKHKRNKKPVPSKKQVVMPSKPASITKAGQKRPSPSKTSEHAGVGVNTEQEKPANTAKPFLASAYAVIPVEKKNPKHADVECIVVLLCTDKQKPWNSHNFGKLIGKGAFNSQIKNLFFINRR